jgi:hypothetical protein
MSAEFHIKFSEPGWLPRFEADLVRALCQLETYAGHTASEWRMKGTENREGASDWDYDVRLIPKPPDQILLEISAHPPSIERALKELLQWIRRRTSIAVVDEDNEQSAW